MNIIVDSQTGEITEQIISDEELAQAAEREEQAAWNELRRQRDLLLVSCDWTVLADTPTSTAAWKTYRQELRDLPANTTDPFNPVWPTPPA